MKKYSVGQIIYVVLRKEGKLLPVQVVEEITKRSLTGESTNYAVKIGRGDASKTLLMSELMGEIFESADRAREALITKATSSIIKIVVAATNRAKEWYGVQEDTQTNEDPMGLSDLVQDNVSEDEVTMIELPNGQKARVKSVKVTQALQG